MARENFTYTDFTEGYRVPAQGAFEALGYNLDPNLSSVEEANCAYLMQRASQMLFGVVGFLGQE